MRLLTAAVILFGGLGIGAAGAQDKPADKKPVDKKPVAPPPTPLSLRAERDKQLAQIAYDTALKGSKMWERRDERAYEGCFRYYQGALEAVYPFLGYRPKLAELVKQRLDKARDMKPEQGAFILREALDAIQKETAAGFADGAGGVGRAGPAAPPGMELPKKPLWDRLGGEKAVRALVHDFVAAALKDPKVNFTRGGKYKLDDKAIAKLEQLLVEGISVGADGPLPYKGSTLEAAHKGMKITNAEFFALLKDLSDVMKRRNVPEAEQIELLEMIGKTRGQIVGQ